MKDAALHPSEGRESYSPDVLFMPLSSVVFNTEITVPRRATVY